MRKLSQNVLLYVARGCLGSRAARACEPASHSAAHRPDYGAAPSSDDTLVPPMQGF